MECCKVKYEAFDGKLFESKEECKKYNELPRVHILKCSTVRTDEIIKVFVNKKAAEKHRKELENLQGKYGTGRYYIMSKEIDLESSEPPTLHEQITNSTKPKRPSWVDKVKEWVLYK